MTLHLGCKSITERGNVVWRQTLALLLTLTLTVQLTDLTRKSYLELLEISPGLRFSEKDYENAHNKLEKDEESEQDRLEKTEDTLKDQIKASRKQLDSLNKSGSRDTAAKKNERQKLHCKILDLEAQLRDTETERTQGVPILFENRFAKLDLIQKWPPRKQEIERLIASGQARNREFGDVEDIGIRIVGEGQQNDIKTGEEAIREMKSLQLMAKEVQDKELQQYVANLGATIAKT